MKEDTYILFDAYLNNELDNEAKTSFENDLSTNEEFKQEFEIYKAINNSLSSKFEHEEKEISLKETLTNLGNSHITKEKKGKVISMKKLRPLMVAASIALLVAFFLFKNGNPTYSEYAHHDNLELVVRGDNNATLEKAETAFNTGNYKTAFAQLTVLESQYPNDVEIQFYKGICLLELEKHTQAETLFFTISEGNSVFKYKATWYLSLTYLKQKQFEKCKTTLLKIPAEAEEYKQAQDLLGKL